MKMLKLLGAALAAVTMTFTAQAAKTAKAVVADSGKTLKFVYDETNYGTKGTDWFSVAEAEAINPDNEDVPWYGKRSTVTKAVFAESFAAYQPKSVASWFYNFTKLTAVEGVAYWDTSKATTFYALFAKCSGLTTLDLAGLSTTSAKNLGSMFNGCTSLTTICASDAFDTSASGNSNNMFKDCTALVGGNGTPFDSAKTNGEYARIDKDGQPGYFTSAVAKAVVEDGGKTLRFVYDGKDYGTKGTHWFSVADAEAIDPQTDDVPWYGKRSTVTKVVFDPSFAAYRPKQCGSWFYDFDVLAAVDGLKNLDTSVATNMVYMFGGCSLLTTIDVTRFDTSNVTDMEGMFFGCSSLTVLDVSGFDTAKVTGMAFMFYGCSSLTTLDVTVFDTANVTNMSCMFEDCSSLMTLDVSGFDTAKVTSMSGMFYGCSSLTTLDVSGFDTAKVTDMSGMLGGCSKLVTLDVTGFDTANVTYMDDLFYGCSSLTTLDVSGFDTANVTDMYSMFYGCSSLTTLDVSGFDTANVTDMSWMFYGCSSLTSLDVTSFDTSKVTSMWSMFRGCSSLSTITASDKFVTTAVTTSGSMFENCTALVGGAGTAYDSTKTDKTYARIDGKDGLPGYFTSAIPTLFDSFAPGALNPKGATYNGFLGEESLGGTFTLVVKKPKKGLTTVDAILTKIDPATGKKVKVSGAVDTATGLGAGGLAGLQLNARGVGGSFGGMPGQGAVDAGKAKDAAALAVLNGFNKRIYGLVFVDAAGEEAYLTATFSTKGKVKVAGSYRGAKVSGSTVMSVGDRCAVPFVWSKKGVTVAFVLWFDKEKKTLLDVSGLGAGAKLVAAGSAEAPAATYNLVLNQDAVKASVPDAIPQTFDPIVLSFDGRKFTAAKAAKVSYKKGELTVDTSKGDNVTGLKLSYSKGVLKGSFTVYAVTAGKLVKNKFTVAGVLIDGVGYAAGTNKKLPAIPFVLAK